MDFSLTTVFVNPSGSTLANSGDTSALTPGKIGIFKKDYSAVAGGSDLQFVIAQGRNAGETLSTSKKSDIIDRSKIIRYHKVDAVTNATQKVYTVGDFTIRCGEEVNLSLKIFERYLDSAYSDGLTKTYVMPQAPCCPCDEDTDPCEVLDAEAIVDYFVGKINNDKLVSKYVVASKSGSGATAALVITGVAQPAEKIGDSIVKNPYYAPNVVDFFVYVTKNAPTSFDQEVIDLCGAAATVTLTTDRAYPRGSGYEVATTEARHYSYQTDKFKHLYDCGDFNVGFVPNADPSLYYDEFIIKFRPITGNLTWNTATEQDNTVRIFVATSDSASFESALDTVVGSSSINTEY